MRKKPKKTVFIIILATILLSILFCFLLFETTAIYDVDVSNFYNTTSELRRPITVSEIARKVEQEKDNPNIPEIPSGGHGTLPGLPGTGTGTVNGTGDGVKVDTICKNIPVLDNTSESTQGTLVYMDEAFKEHNKPLSSWATRCYSDYNKIGKTLRGRANGMHNVDGTAFDADGRVAIGVGPAIMNPSRKDTDEPTAAEMKYGSKVDIVLEKDGKQFYVAAVVVDCKAHTYPTWIVQTGYARKNGNLYFTGPGSKDQYTTPDVYDKNLADTAYTGGGAIEFTSVAGMENCSSYSIVGVIVY